MGGRLAAFVVVAATAAGLIVAPAAEATFHLIKVREVYAGTNDDSYVELQMYAAGQSLLSGHSMTVYDSAGALAHSSTFSAGVAKSENQRTVLVGGSNVEASFGIKPDLVDSGLAIPAAGGAACWNAGGIPADCVAWGDFSGGAALEAATGTTVGTPVSAGGIMAGKAIRRKITPGCATLLEGGDDTNDSATDFEFEEVAAPRNNASAIIETGCAPPSAPDTSIGTKPPSPTKSTEATFTFTASPPAEATFQCKLDLEAFSACTSPKTYTGLASTGQTGTTHTFEVRAVHPVDGTDPTPAKHTWIVDTQAPTASLSSHPNDPSPGASATFKYSSNETSSTFKCRLSPTQASFASCPKTGETYTSLTDGEYTFEVLAIDPAGNAQSELAPTTFHWTVNNAVPDTTPPETTIDVKPPDPTDSPNVSFTYHSTETGSTFTCKLDSEPEFASCPAAGISYSGLANGSHSFQVRAKDPSGNVDPMPAGYTFNVVSSGLEPVSIFPPASKPNTKISTKPPAKTHDRTPTLRFRSTITPATFECKLDGKPFKSCRSPLTTKSLSFGRHTIKVRAVAGGAADPTPAQASFKVVKG